jgi:hypothetical protein
MVVSVVLIVAQSLKTAHFSVTPRKISLNVHQSTSQFILLVFLEIHLF